MAMLGFVVERFYAGGGVRVAIGPSDHVRAGWSAVVSTDVRAEGRTWRAVAVGYTIPTLLMRVAQALVLRRLRRLDWTLRVGRGFVILPALPTVGA